MKLADIKAPISDINGVGPTLTKAFSRLNIFSVCDLLQYYPKDYEDRTARISISHFYQQKKVHTVARVISHEWFGYGRMKTLKIKITDNTGFAELICFNRAFLERVLTIGSIILVSGHFEEKYGTVQSSSFEANVVNLEKLGIEIQNQDISKINLFQIPLTDCRIYPLYRLTEGVSQKIINKIMTNAVSQYLHGIENEIPENILKKRNLLSKQKAIELIHNPKNQAEIDAARKTLSYEELYNLQKVIVERSLKHRGKLPSENIDLVEQIKIEQNQTVTKEDFEASLSPLEKKFFEKLPFELTDDQRKVIFEMNGEIDTGYRQRVCAWNHEVQNVFTMNRLLQGDVGSGKTLVAIFLCLRVISWKGQCAFMAPTEILALQHAETIFRQVADLGVRTAFLTGNVKSKERNNLLSALKKGDIDIIVGTHALFSSGVIYNDLQLVVIDEQHRFGVLQRQAIIQKGRKTENGNLVLEPHVLMMSATPIPQSLALTVFGDLDISSIRTKPNGRKEIQTFLVKEGNEGNAYEAVRTELKKGHQAYFVYPAIETGFEEDESTKKIKAAEEMFVYLSKIYSEFKCGLIHSRVEEEAQNQILKDFHDGKIQILVATTVIEVGVDNPNATCMVIEQADRFGMAQLHQLRGRVGRSDLQSYCFLIYSKKLSESGIERMKTLRQSTDGFYIAEQDLVNRGPGEVNGTMQSGELALEIADVVRDKKLLLEARSDVISQYK